MFVFSQFIIRNTFFEVTSNVLTFGEVANFVTDYFHLKIKFLAKRKRELTSKFAILPNVG